MSFLQRDKRCSRAWTVVAVATMALAIVASVVVVPSPASAQSESPTMRIRKAQQLVHRSVLSFETAGLAPATGFRVSQCTNKSEAHCVNLGEATTNDDGKITARLEARRELFAGEVRSDCAEIACVVIYDDGTNRFVLPVDFSNDYPMATMDAGPLSGLAAGAEITVTANGYRPSSETLNNTVWMCPENDESWEACAAMAPVEPLATVSFTVPQILNGPDNPYDCAATGNGCYLRIGTYEARWNLDFSSAAKVGVLKWGSRKNLRNGETVQVEVTSATTQLTVVQCVKSKGEDDQWCTSANATSTNVASTSGVLLTQTLTAVAQRYLYVAGERRDCTVDRCFLEVRTTTRGDRLGEAVRIYFFKTDPLPEATLKVPRKKIAPDAKVRITLRNIPEAKRYVVWQCVAGTTDCVELHTGKIRAVNLKKAMIRKKVPVVESVGGVDCVGKRGICTIVVTTKQSKTVRLEAPLKVG